MTTPNGSASQGTSENNDADVMFAQMMIPHHEQAVEMASLAGERADSPDVKKLAEKIQAAQQPEIDTLTSWLQQWGETPAAGGQHGGPGGGGMMAEADMAQLEGARGAAFDTLFLTMMIEHHEGAISMAEAQLAQGQYPEAKAMAKDIVTSQTAEVQQMRDLLDRG